MLVHGALYSFNTEQIKQQQYAAACLAGAEIDRRQYINKRCMPTARTDMQAIVIRCCIWALGG